MEIIKRVFDDDVFKAWIIILFGIWMLSIAYPLARTVGSNLSFLLSGFYFGKWVKASHKKEEK